MEMVVPLSPNNWIRLWSTSVPPDNRRTTKPEHIVAYYSKGILLYCGISFLTGFASKKFNEKLDELASTVFSTAASSATANAPSFVISGFPDTVTAGTAGSITITAKDANDKIATGYGGTVHFTSSDSKAVLPSDYTFQPSDAGVHTFAKEVTLETAGSHSITVADSGFSSIKGAQTDITVNAATASKLVFTGGAGQSLTANVVSPIAIVVQQQDAYDNPVKSGTSAITVGLTTSSSSGKFYSDSKGTIPITSIQIAAGSNSSSSFYYLDTAVGSLTLTATCSGLTSATTQFTIATASTKP